MSEQKRIATNVNRGLAWIGAASSLVGILDIVALLIILNNWVSKEEYGIAAMSVWLYPILDQATDLGLSGAVIQRDDHDDAKISTVFWINLMIAAGLFAILVVFAPTLSVAIFGHEIIGWMLIAYGTKLLWQNVYFIPGAMMKRELRFRELAVIRVLANLAEFFGKVGFAAAGFGIWCFVLGPLCRVLVTGIGCQLRHPWRPKLIFKFREAREYVTFGLRTSGSQILFYFYTNIDYPIVGYYFGPVALGIYKLAYDIVLEPVRVISQVVVDVAFPAFARLQHARDRLTAQLVSFTKLNLITVMTFAAIVFVTADDLIAVLFPSFTDAGAAQAAAESYAKLVAATDQLTAVTGFAMYEPHGYTVVTGTSDAIRILCAVAVLRAVGFVIPPLLNGVNYPNRTFNYMLVAAIVLPASFMLCAVLLGDQLGFLSVAVAWAVGYPIAFGVLVWLAVYTLQWSVRGYLRSIAGVAGSIVLAAVAAFGLHLALDGEPPAVRLLASAIVIVVGTGFLLAYTQGMSVRTAFRALKGEPDAVVAGAPAEGARDDDARKP